MNVFFSAFGNKLAILNFSLLVINYVSQFEPEAIFAFLALFLADVFVLVV